MKRRMMLKRVMLNAAFLSQLMFAAAGGTISVPPRLPGKEAIDVFKDRVCNELSGKDAQGVRNRFESLMEGDTARKNVAEAALLLGQLEIKGRRTCTSMENYFEHLQDTKVGGMAVVLKLERATKALESLQTGRHDGLSQEASKRRVGFSTSLPLPRDGGGRFQRRPLEGLPGSGLPCLQFLEMVTGQPACAEFRAVCVGLMMMVDDPENLSRMLKAAEPVVLYFALRSKAAPMAERQERAWAMMTSFGLCNEQKIPAAYSNQYMLTPEERSSCLERLDALFIGTKRNIVATAVLLKLNSLMDWKCMESVVSLTEPCMVASRTPPCMVASLEHVLPQKAAGTSWEADWPYPEERGEWCYMLGNLAIVHYKMNSKMGNGDFAKKKEEFRTSPFPLTREIAGFFSWEKKDVNKSQKKLRALAKKGFGL